MSLKRIQDPIKLVVALDDVKFFLRIDGTSEDAMITRLIKSATTLVENYTERSLITQRWAKTWDQIPTTNRLVNDDWYDGVKELPVQFAEAEEPFLTLGRGVLQTVQKVFTFDDSNFKSTFSSVNYYLDIDSIRPRVVLNDGAIWPTNLRDQNAIRVEYTTGYGDDESHVPEDIKQAIISVVVDMYENRCPSSSNGLSKMATNLLESYKIRTI